MKRLFLLLRQEFCIARTALLLHLVALLQPALLFWLLSYILVHPTFEMNLARLHTAQGFALAEALSEVGSPDGTPYVRVQILEVDDWNGRDQLVVVEPRGGVPAAVQYFGYIDSNLVKNYRNRLTAAALKLWDADLGGRAVQVHEQPWLPREMPYSVYFGMAMLPLAGFLAAAALGAAGMAQEFESGTVMVYRLAPVPAVLMLGVRLLRLVLTGWLSAGVLLVCIGLRSGAWPSSLAGVALVLFPVLLFAGCLGMMAGIALQRLLSSFVFSLIVTLVSWMLGSSFGLAGGFGGWYALLSRLSPNTYAVELLFSYYYGIHLGQPWLAGLMLVGFCLLALSAAAWFYLHRVRSAEPAWRGKNV